MSKRTAEQVERLWPAGDVYRIEGLVEVDLATPQAVAVELQRLFDTEGGVAGFFDVTATKGPGAFAVTFTRDVAEDYEVVEPALLDGGDLLKVLVAQLAREIKDAAQRVGSKVDVTLTTFPVFGNY